MKGFEVYFDKKLVAELRDVTDLRKESNDQYKNMNAYNLVFLESSGIIEDLVSSFDGMAHAKEQTKNVIARSLLDKTKSEGGWSSLREKFQEMEYDKKGQPLTEWKIEERELAEREKNKKAHGGLSEKELLFLKDLRTFGFPERASNTLYRKLKNLSEGKKAKLTEKERFDLNGYIFKHFEQKQGTDEAIFNSIDDLELLDKKLRPKKAMGGLIDKPLPVGSRYI